MIELDILIDILSISVEKNGKIPLTNLHLLNILKMTHKKIDADEECADLAGYQVYTDTL